MDATGLAVACHLCGAEAGKPCAVRVFPLTHGLPTHQQRQEMAEAFGFALAGKAAAPPEIRDLFSL